MTKTIISLIIFFLGVFNGWAENQGGSDMRLISPAFNPNGMISSEFTCQGKDINPELNISGIPEGTQSLSLIVDDPDAPMGTWIHWVVFNIPPTIIKIKENSIPGLQGFNDFSGTHRYFFKLYVLDTTLNLKEGVRKQALEKAMRGHILAQTELIGLYKK